MRQTLPEPVNSLLEIKKSRFIGCVEPVTSMEQGQERVQALRQQHPDATHVCFCLLVNGQVRQSDDGEPSGTAAAPMMNVLQHKHLDQVLATVVRYFGGIKLGAGGLVRAYSQAISEPLQSAVYVELKTFALLHLTTAFEHESLLRRLAEQAGLRVQIDYSDGVVASLEGEQAALDQFLKVFSEQVRGQLQLFSDQAGNKPL